VIVSESGLHTNEDLQLVREAGAKAVLIGEFLAKQKNPTAAISQLFNC
jgi:indole-3-glycerol phosphate synthase